MKRLFWEELYTRDELLWGPRPDYTLVEYAHIIPKGHVLDIGIGEGRNALFFAQKGFTVEGVDISKKAVEKCRAWARKTHLHIKVTVGDLRKIKITPNKYSLIIAAWVLNFFKQKEIETTIIKIKQGLHIDGFVYCIAFSPRDPSYKRNKQTLKIIEKNTFYSRKRRSFMHYFTRSEILSLFSDFKVISCMEGIVLDTSHGDKPHYHGIVDYLGKK